MENTSETLEMMTGEDDAGKRVDVWLAEWSGLSRSRLKALMLDGHIICDGAAAQNPSAKVRPEQEYSITVPAAVEAEPEPEDIPLDILYEDTDLLVVNKPAGMTVHPAAGNWSGTLVNALLFHAQKSPENSLSGIGGVLRPGIVHRIDKDTSGILVVAKTDKAHRGLSKQFAAHTMERAYICFTRKAPNPREGRIETRLARHPSDRKKMAVVKPRPPHLLRFDEDEREPKGKEAVTNYTFQRGYGQEKGGSIGTPLVSQIECRLETGRTHQIRVHMAHIHCPLLGDPVYGKSGGFKTANSDSEMKLKAALSNFSRQALHAKSLGFIHPVTKEEMYFETDLPADMQALEAALCEL